ncbi:MAG: nucleotidyl transferase AbiEii/AbiGii toxin family protein [Geoalkalibacter sp.]|jgi:predicted HTH transcriptional regulator|uniref:nucleotidyl transferase AbiEii/AbiGii toxin family protein n=1 Tax=Geoalkalibacter sp. TaxID=3041440 RepID=UPI002A99E24F|nr:nucleotidyl transferase AbiEii/AbiGii toxin family protein [Thermodesulfobacteriota bacterium]
MDSRYQKTVALLLDTMPFVFEQKCFAMKGGTAINLFCRDMPRLSVDIDLVFIDSAAAERAEALAAIQVSLQHVAEQLKHKLHVNVQRTTSGSDQETKLFVSQGDTRVKIEVNHVFRGSVYPIVEGNQIIEFFQKEGRIRFDELSHAKAVYPDDFDPDAFARFLKLAGISPSIDRDTLLRNLDCLTADNRLTNAGVLCFARDIDFLLNHAIVGCVLYKGNDKVHILDKKDFQANLVDNIDNAMLFIQRHTKLR